MSGSHYRQNRATASAFRAWSSLHHAAPGRNQDIVVVADGGHALALQIAMLASLPSASSSSSKEDDVR